MSYHSNSKWKHSEKVTPELAIEVANVTLANSRMIGDRRSYGPPIFAITCSVDQLVMTLGILLSRYDKTDHSKTTIEKYLDVELDPKNGWTPDVIAMMKDAAKSVITRFVEDAGKWPEGEKPTVAERIAAVEKGFQEGSEQRILGEKN